MRHFLSFVLLLLVTFTLPAVGHAKKFTIDTEPISEGRVYVNGNFVGIAPVEVDLKLRKDQLVVANAEKDGAVSYWPTRFGKKQRGIVVVRLEKDDAFASTTSSDVANTWLSVRPSKTTSEDGSVSEQLVWQKMVSVVTDDFSDLEQMDRGSYYLRTAWRVREYDYRSVRHRLVVKRDVGSGFGIKVMLESQIAAKDKRSTRIRDEDYKESDRVYASDKDTIEFLRDQL